MAKFAAEAPIPIMRVMVAVAVKPGVRRRDRKAYRKDCRISINAFWSGGRTPYAPRTREVSVRNAALTMAVYGPPSPRPAALTILRNRVNYKSGHEPAAS